MLLPEGFKMMVWALAGLGLVILLLAGDALVKGAVNLSLRVGIPSLIVSLTVVAFGTSAPELLVSINAVLMGKPGLALGNVVGSNTANVLLVLGLPAMLAVIHTSECDSRKSYIYMLLATLLFVGLALLGTFTFVSGIILLVPLVYILFDMARDAKRHRSAERAAPEEEIEGADPDMAWWKITVFLLLGLCGLPLGADLLVDHASIIANDYGVTDAVIGLTLVALGTSLPELATTVMAALRRQADVVLGNVIGSNFFNLLGIVGVTALIGPIPVDPEFLEFDLWVMLAAALVLIPFVFYKVNIGRGLGALLSVAYVAYVVVTILI